MATWNGVQWVDDTNPNVKYNMEAGIWENAVEGTFMDPSTNQWYLRSTGQPVGVGAPVTNGPPPLPGTSGAVPNSTSPYVPNPGYQAQKDEGDRAQETLIQQMINDSNMNVQRLQSEMALEQSKGNNASAERIAQLNAEINRETNRIALLNAQTLRMGEERQQRETEARLSANPSDTVAYEFWKRNAGTPGTLGTSPGVGGTQTSGFDALNNSNGAPFGNSNINGGGAGSGATSAAGPGNNPAYSDSALQSLAAGLFNGGSNQPAYNPNMRGTGVFGANIPNPNSLGRAEFGALSDSQKQIMGSFLKGGVNIGGRRVALDPVEWFSQAQNSWVPTLDEGAGRVTQYA